MNRKDLIKFVRKFFEIDEIKSLENKNGFIKCVGLDTSGVVVHCCCPKSLVDNWLENNK